MTVIYVAPTEPPAIKSLADGKSSSRPEKYGVDVLWRAAAPNGEGQWHGVQRKEIKDFLASVQDGRLTREIAQMRVGVAMPVLVIEGRASFTTDGLLAVGQWHASKEWSISAWWSLMLSLSAKGVFVHVTRDKVETAAFISQYVKWSTTSHTTFDSRPGPVNPWGKRGNEDYERHLLQGLDGCGPETARAIVAKFGGVPWAWTCTADELAEVEGIGKKTAAKFIGAMGGASEASGVSGARDE